MFKDLLLFNVYFNPILIKYLKFTKNHFSCLAILILVNLFFLDEVNSKEIIAQKINISNDRKKITKSSDSSAINKLSLEDSSGISTLPKLTVIANSLDSNSKNYSSQNTLSANRTKTSLLDTPQAISVINQEQIREQNITDMEHAVRYIPSFNIQQGEGNRDQLTIRGNSSSADFFIDSIRDDLQYFRDFYNIKTIEFLRGPNALSFGRGGAGGLVNRVKKTADSKAVKSFNLATGSFNNKRLAIDFGDKITNKFFSRINAVYEKSDSFRNFVNYQKYGINPTATWILNDKTDLKFSYEHFADQRIADRGVPSKNNEAVNANPSAFFGNPYESYANTKIDNFSTILNHDFSSETNLRNQISYSLNNKFYQNIYANSSIDSNDNFKISAYNNLTQRKNFTNQLDLTHKFKTYNIKHQTLFGSEITRQDSISLRKNGNFNDTSSTLILNTQNSLDYSSINFYKNKDVNNLISEIRVYGLYFQDQIEFNKYWQLIAGIRQDRFEINIRNNHDLTKLSRIDSLTSPRLGIIFKPKEKLSIYSSYSVSYLPSAGDQFDNFNDKIKALKPEKMQNYEIGSKYDINQDFSISSALFELQRTNTKANDPNKVGYYTLSGESRSRGVEFEAKGKILPKINSNLSYSLIDARIVGQTSTASKNNIVALAPKHKFTWENKYIYDSQLSLALAFIRQSSQFAGVDNSSKLNGFKRFDFNILYKINKNYKVQLNIENIFNEKYFLTAHNNNNLMPGSTRYFRINFNVDL